MKRTARASEQATQRVRGHINPTFISYRRSDCQDVAVELRDLLAARLGSVNVFLDERDIEPGRPFPKVLRDRLQSAGAMIVLIGPTWASARTGRTRRLFAKHDWCRTEVEIALKRRIPLFPVLVKGATLPRARELPRSIQRLGRYQVAARLSGSASSLGHALARMIRKTGFHLTTRQQTWFKGKDREDPDEHWWEWRVRLAGPKSQLDEVQVVRYHVGDEWTPPVWKCYDRRSGFALELEGYDDFVIPIDVRFKDGSVVKLRHSLVLE